MPNNFWVQTSWIWSISQPSLDTWIIQPPKLDIDTSSLPQNKPEWAKNLFSDEQNIYDQMITDWLDDTTARWLIGKKRKTLLTEISQEEWKVLSQMITDWLDSETAAKVVRENRYKNLPLWKKALKVPFDVSVWATWLATEQVWNLLDFTTGWQFDFKKQWEEARMIWKRTTWDSLAAKTWEVVLWAWEMMAIWPKKIASTMKWRTVQWAIVWWAIWAWSPILEKWADVTPWEIVKWWAVWATIWAAATPILEKAVAPIIWKTIQKVWKYWKAWIKWWAKGAWKSIVRDIKRPFTEIKAKWIAPEKAASLSTKANRFNAKDIEDFKRITWETPGEFATKRWMTKVWDEAVEEATSLYRKSMSEADDALKMIDWNFKIKKWPDYLWEMLNDLEWRLIKTIWPWSRKVKLLNKKYNTQWLSMSEINKIKRLYSRNFKYSWLEAGWESALRSKNLQDWVRKWQFKTAWEEWLSNLKEINKTTQWWKTFADNLSKKLKRSSWNNNISLTDWVTLSWWNPSNIALFLWKKTWELTPVKRALIKTLGKQTKPSIIQANRWSILKSNIKKRNVNVDRILRDRTSGSSTPVFMKPKPLGLPEWKRVTPQTIKKWKARESYYKNKALKQQEREVIKQSKEELKWAKIIEWWKKIDNKDTLLSKPKNMTTKIKVWMSKSTMSDLEKYGKRKTDFKNAQDEINYLEEFKWQFWKDTPMYQSMLKRISNLKAKTIWKSKAISEKKADKAFNTDDKYIYHITDKNNVDSILRNWLRSSKEWYGWPWVYMANTKANTLWYWEDITRSVTLKIDKKWLIKKYWLYPEKPNWIEFDSTNWEILLGWNRTIPKEFISISKSPIKKPKLIK